MFLFLFKKNGAGIQEKWEETWGLSSPNTSPSEADLVLKVTDLDTY